MRTSRIYYAEKLEAGQTVVLDAAASRHVGIVLRLTAGHSLVLFNGDGFDYFGEIVEIAKNIYEKNRKTKSNLIYVKLLEKKQNHAESKLNIHLVQSISRSEKLDWIFQKAVELGVNEITPVISDYCSVKFKSEKIDRFKKILISASEQSGRALIPRLNQAIVLSEFLRENKKKFEKSCNIMFDPHAQDTLHYLQNNINKSNFQDTCFQLLMGPEGGFSEQEIELAQNVGFHLIRLGNRILRMETASVCAISAMQALWGDYY